MLAFTRTCASNILRTILICQWRSICQQNSGVVHLPRKVVPFFDQLFSGNRKEGFFDKSVLQFANSNEKIMNSNKNSKWPAEIEEFLIDIVQGKEHLWNPRSPLYSKKSLKRLSYEEVVEHLKTSWPDYSHLFTVEMVLKKFQNMRTYFQRELKKSKCIKSVFPANNGFTSKWIHFDHLSFLQDSMESCSSNIDLLYSEEMDMMSYEIKKEDPTENLSISELPIYTLAETSSEENTPNSPISRKSQPCKTNRKRKSDFGSMEKLLQEAISSLNKLNSQQQDSDNIFGTYIAASLKLIHNERHKELAKIKIMEVINEFRFNPI